MISSEEIFKLIQDNNYDEIYNIIQNDIIIPNNNTYCLHFKNINGNYFLHY